LTSPIVTIIVPIYNGERHLRETVDSLLSQSFGTFELLAIDDGSTDASSEIVRSFKDDRIRLIRKENSGLCNTLNLGIEEAKSQFIARNDQDDISTPQRLERQLKVMSENPDAIGLFSYNTKVGSRRTWSNADKLSMAGDNVRAYEPDKDGCLLGSTMFARASVLKSIGGFRQSYYPADDFDLELRLAQAGKVMVLQEPLVAYRFHESASTYRKSVFADIPEKNGWALDSYERRARSVRELTFEEFVSSRPNGFWSNLAKRRMNLARLSMRTAGHRYLDGHYIAGAAHLAMGVALDPVGMLGRTRRYLGRE
jgi:glycosyltransferase involved in cell wall biosynthesis